MKKLLHLAGPLGLALLVIGSGWAVLIPDAIPWTSQALLAAGAVLLAVGIWVRRDLLLAPAGTRRAKQGAGALASVAIAAAIVLLANFLAVRYNERIDMTRTGAFSLHAVTRRALQAVPEGVEIVAFFPANDRGQFRTVRNFLETVAAEQPRVKVTVVDPNQQPEIYAQLGRPGMRVIVVHRGERRVTFPGFDEADLAAALVEVSREAPKVIYWMIGHGERPYDARGALGYRRLQAELAKEYYEIRSLSLGPTEQVPGDASLVVLADPRRPLSAEEAAAYHQYLRGGGRILALIDVDIEQPEEGEHPLALLLDRWGLVARRGLIIDLRGRTGDRDPRNVDGDTYPHPSVGALQGQLTVFPVARPVEFRQVMEDQQIFHYKLVEVGPDPQRQGRDPFAVTDLSLVTATAEQVSSLRPPGSLTETISVAVGAFRKFPPPEGSQGRGREARIVLVGDADALSDARIDQVANRELGVNVVRWLTSEELLIRREGETRYAREAMNLTPLQMKIVLALTVGVPVVIFLLGWVVWLMRRSR